ncbi:hypothetical protein MITS9504_02429 [Synechococcus sp. MIT S9504]|nr:hypothetical protein MITS9504_02429 [Synechococcus sp. MIT S9504]
MLDLFLRWHNLLFRILRPIMSYLNHCVLPVGEIPHLKIGQLLVYQVLSLDLANTCFSSLYLVL